ncbi:MULTISPECIES: hypothetical protein [unclassified Crossiella]|uniref:hypothetical protein n=1 Tax=unclassified Crossiella TaxID=2620835 RepID=UPI001FFF010C|nr:MULTISPECIES: hypothetical protein [unclassified Crossiella]MCK2245159.1 hypothetical protein [Crossiella sp. S99.2]MCK2258812.1 hypothetical protein [Crossiella sp. S99.1]
MRTTLDPVRGAVRVLRGSVLALCSSALSGAAHGLAGGQVDDGVLTVLLTLIVAAAGTALAGRRRGLPGILLVLGLAQCVQHVLFDLTEHGHAGPGLADPALMTLAHVLAALATAFLLVNAESALFALFAALGVVARRRPVPLPVSTSPRLAILGGPAPLLLELLLSRLRTRRGPPAFSS